MLDFNNVHAETHGWWMGTEGPWMDLTTEEFKAQMTLQTPEERTGQPFTYGEVEAPKAVDWRPKGVVTPVKNQGMCGSCWSFSTTGSIEGLYALKTGNLRSFSEQELVDCDQYDMGCNGGLMDNAFKWVQEHGLTDEKTYSYQGTRGKCSAAKEASNPYKITGHADVPHGNEKALQQAISQQPVSVAVDATLWQFYLGRTATGQRLQRHPGPLWGSARPRRPGRGLQAWGQGQEELLHCEELLGQDVGRERLHPRPRQPRQERHVRYRQVRVLPPSAGVVGAHS